MPKELFRHLFTSKNACGDRGTNGRLTMTRRIPFPDLASWTLTILTNQVVQIRTSDLATLPSVELRTKLEEGTFELSIMSNASLLSDETFLRFRRTGHRLSVFGCQRPRFSRGGP
jgi:hypothetical protein